MAAGSTDGTRAPGASIVPRAQPVPAPPPGVTDVLRRSARLGLGAMGLAGRAAGSVFARVPDPSATADAEPGPLALLPGAVLGLAIEAERRAATVVDAVADRTAARGPHGAAAGDRAAGAAPGRGRAVALERGGPARAEPQPGAGGRAHPGDRAAGHRERHRPDRLRARGRADPGRRDRRRHRRRGDRAAHRPRWRDPRVDDGSHHARRSTRCARRASRSTTGRRGSSTRCCSASSPATSRSATEPSRLKGEIKQPARRASCRADVRGSCRRRSLPRSTRS